MFNKDFYPTPQSVIEQMLVGVDLKDRCVLEPSGGKADIIDYLNLYGAKVTYCEINKDLASICSGKATFLKNNFLDVKSDEISHINLIVMNPPFSADEEHINHAYDIAHSGCEIIALCNSETLKNAYTKSRRILLKSVNDYGKVEYLGNCFSNSERKTDVEVSLVRLFKPKEEGEFEFEGYFDLDEQYESQSEGIMKYDEILDIVNRYVSSVKAFNSISEKEDEINSLISPLGSNIAFGAFERNSHSDFVRIGREEFKKNLQKSAWKNVFGKLNVDKYVTKSVRDDINKFVEQQEKVPFTRNNIYKMIEMIMGTRKSRMEKVLVEVFDRICQYSSKNSEAGDGWKTNSDYKVNKTFIVPWGVNKCTWDTSRVDLNYSRAEDIEDMMKAFCFLEAKNYDEIIDFGRIDNRHIGYAEKSFINEEGKEIEKGFRRLGSIEEKNPPEGTEQYLYFGRWYNYHDLFEVKFFKKGTIHFKFKEDRMWENFNRTVSKIKGWVLPTATDTKTTGRERSKASGITLF